MTSTSGDRTPSDPAEPARSAGDVDAADPVDRLLAELTLDEKAALTAGHDFWWTKRIDRLGIPRVGASDGPSGARGPWLMGESEARSVCVPCGSALGATWDPQLVERVGALLGQQARQWGCRVLLAPTVNLHRSPLAGRNFECYSEDPLLSGRLAAALVRGAQARGVVTTVKHLVGNEAEHERNTMSSVIDERTLREIYLVPFELAVREGGALGVMTAYNRLNGAWCSERPDLLTGILREEWGFEGFVVTDWFGVASTVDSARAGVDLEMPGPGRAFGEALATAVRAGELDESVVDAQVGRLLTVFDRIGALDDPGDAGRGAGQGGAGEAGPGSPDVAGTGDAGDVGDAGDPGAGSEATPEQQALAREAAQASMVLLTNPHGLLPLDPQALRRVAVIGPNAGRAVIMGGGSSQVTPPYRVPPAEGLRQRLGEGVEVLHEPGVQLDVAVPALRAPLDLAFHAGDDLAVLDAPGREPAHRAERRVAELLWFGSPDPAVPDPFVLRARGAFEPTVTGPHRVTLAQSGRARVRIGGEVVLDGIAAPPPRGASFLGIGSEEVETTVELQAGLPVEVVVDYTSEGSGGLHGVKVGCVPVPRADLRERAVTAAAAADVAVVVVGTTREWESEGFDRTSLHLPGDQDALVAEVAATNPWTVVVVNAGAPVAMPWVDEAAAVLQVWFGGQEMARGLADVLFGDAEPGGRLPTTFPRRLEHNPSYGTFPGANDENRYGEGLLVGYRWYDTRDIAPLFPFGHGLSYTSFQMGVPALSAATIGPGDELAIDIPVANTGSRRGSEVVQCYVAPLDPPVFRPAKELKAFGKITLDPGATGTVRLVLGERAFAHWEPGPGDRGALRARVPLADGRVGVDEPAAEPPEPELEAGVGVGAGDEQAGSEGAGSAPAGAGGPEGAGAERGTWRVAPGTYELHIGRSSADIQAIVPLEVTGP